MSKAHNIKKLTKLKKPDFFKAKKLTKLVFFTNKARLIINQLKKIFIKILIICYFDLKYQISIKTDMSGYTINKTFDYINSNLQIFY